MTIDIRQPFAVDKCVVSYACYGVIGIFKGNCFWDFNGTCIFVRIVGYLSRF